VKQTGKELITYLSSFFTPYLMFISAVGKGAMQAPSKMY